MRVGEWIVPFLGAWCMQYALSSVHWRGMCEYLPGSAVPGSAVIYFANVQLEMEAEAELEVYPTQTGGCRLSC